MLKFLNHLHHPIIPPETSDSYIINVYISQTYILKAHHIGDDTGFWQIHHTRCVLQKISPVSITTHLLLFTVQLLQKKKKKEGKKC